MSLKRAHLLCFTFLGATFATIPISFYEVFNSYRTRLSKNWWRCLKEYSLGGSSLAVTTRMSSGTTRCHTRVVSRLSRAKRPSYRSHARRTVWCLSQPPWSIQSFFALAQKTISFTPLLKNLLLFFLYFRNNFYAPFIACTKNMEISTFKWEDKL